MFSTPDFNSTQWIQPFYISNLTLTAQYYKLNGPILEIWNLNKKGPSQISGFIDFTTYNAQNGTLGVIGSIPPPTNPAVYNVTSVQSPFLPLSVNDACYAVMNGSLGTYYLFTSSTNNTNREGTSQGSYITAFPQGTPVNFTINFPVVGAFGNIHFSVL